MIGILMFFTALLLLLIGFPVAFTFGGVALVFGVVAQGWELFALMPYRIYSIMQNSVLMAVPLFILMGTLLQRTRLAEQLLEAMARAFGSIRGGLAVATVLVGALLAASTGVVAASVVAMGVISLPVMLKHGYRPSLACGTICGAGTLGQIIPPSIVLIILGDVLGVSVGELFRAALAPGLVLVGGYVGYLLWVATRNPDAAPAVTDDAGGSGARIPDLLRAVVPPLALMLVVLGSIFAGIATPTESSALGVVGALLLALAHRRLNWRMVFDSALETIRVTAMVFAILVGATAFSMAFTYTGGDLLAEQALSQLPGDKWGFLVFAMLTVLLLGFFIDFVEISFIVVPILAPIADAMGIPMLWFAVLIAMNLQTSFLTPPFGFSLFYLKGVAPTGISTADIYRGVVPFVLIQLAVLLSLLLLPGLYGLSG